MKTIKLCLAINFLIIWLTQIAGADTPPPPPTAALTIIDSVAPINDLYVSFGEVSGGTPSLQTVILRNNGNTEIPIGYIASTNPLLYPFSIESDTCSGQTIAPQSECNFTISFSSNTADSFCDAFDVLYDDATGNVITLTVTGISLSQFDNNPPSFPRLVYPSHNQTDLRTTIKFKWKRSVDPDGDAVSYDLYYCENPYFSGCAPENIAIAYYADISGIGLLFGAIFAGYARKKRIFTLAVILTISGLLFISCGNPYKIDILGNGGTSANVSFTEDEVIYKISGLKTNTKYYWKVVAKDSNGKQTDSCLVWSFTTGQ